MAYIRYTVEQLEHLQQSPLVKKPDDLPSIEQWMDVPNDQNNNNNNNNAGNTANRRVRTNVRENDPTAPSEQRSDRAILNPMGQFGRRQSTQPGDDTVLGPPKFNFASATRGAKPGQTKEPTAITSADGEHPGDRFPRNDRSERWRDRADGERPRDKAFPNGRRAGREEGEGWTNVKGRKSLGQEDFDRGFGRNGDRKDGDADTGEAPRRAANARWPRREETTKEPENSRFGGAGQGGWRDRERNRERDGKDRDWARGGAKEEDPEWMDSPVTKKEIKAHTQEDFQRWKEQMKAKDTPAEEREEPRADQNERAPLASASIEAPMKIALTPSGLEPNLGSMFGNWGKEKGAESSPAEPVPSKAKSDKKSRFMTMFTKPEEQAAPMQAFQATPPSPAPVPDRNADQEGFQRILQMLGGTNIGGPPPAPTDGARQGGGISLDFQSPPPEPQESRAPVHQVQRTLEQQALLENILAPRPPTSESRPQQTRFASMSPDNALPEQFGFPRPNSNRPGDDYPMQQPPPRNNNIQDANLSAILNSRGRENVSDEAAKREREFLLALMTQPQLQNQSMTRPPMEHQGPPAFFEQPNQRPQGQSKGRGGLPPGFMEDPRIHEHEMMRREAERREAERREAERRELQMREMQQESMRNKNRGMPANFPGHEDPSMAGLQRRNTAGEIPRQMTNMGIPSQAVSNIPYMHPDRQPGMQSTPQERQNIAPPPGFGGPMRQPPGLGGPGPQQQQMGPGPSFSAGNTPLGHPPGFAPPGNMRGAGGMFPGGPGGPGGNGMQGPPQGYFPPPGYGPPPMGMRGEDPRMMFEQQFGGPGPRQQGRPGPPNMY